MRRPEIMHDENHDGKSICRTIQVFGNSNGGRFSFLIEIIFFFLSTIARITEKFINNIFLQGYIYMYIYINRILYELMVQHDVNFT